MRSPLGRIFTTIIWEFLLLIVLTTPNSILLRTLVSATFALVISGTILTLKSTRVKGKGQTNDL